MANQTYSSYDALRTIAQGMQQFTFPDLRRPEVSANATATSELISWGTQAYCFSWIRHLCTLLSGIVCLMDTHNKPSARIIARSVYELGAHGYYVKKHVKQHLEAEDFSAAWKFLSPIMTSSRYMKEQFPQEDSLFPLPSHISRIINCISEVMPQSAQEDYSYLSEYAHPNTMTFLQYYKWSDPQTIKFADSEVHGFLGATTAASIQGLLAIQELLTLAHERDVRRLLVRLLRTIAETAGKAKAASC